MQLWEEITLATPSQADEVFGIYAACREQLLSQRIFQWNAHYPSRNLITEDVRQGIVYVLVHRGQCIAAITLTPECEAEYDQIPWLTTGMPALFVHRLAVHPRFQRRGIGTRMMQFAEQLAIRRQMASLRLAVYSGNRPVLHFYEHRGYVFTGELYFPTWELPYFCYEKVLT